MRALTNYLGTFFAVCFLAVSSAAAADRVKLEAFLEVTGFDVALESIKLSARSAPQMLGVDAQDFGSEWKRLTDRVFDVDKMHDMALDILGQTLTDDMLSHAADFYASDLGQRLVAAENASHMTEDDTVKDESGTAILAALRSIQSTRVGHYERMNAASDSAGTAVRALQEIQVRFLMAAAGAGVIELRMDEEDMRAALASGEKELRATLKENGLEGAAYTYQSFSDDEVLEYTEALEHPVMRRVYDLMNAVQFEIMANRFEALAAAMASLQPSQEL
ncbi:MAG: DUF2059 domain-containing protein [Rhodobacteraceae bacterium]|nr:DUF2059 domain-containing protein [Paracoccaceae bacterium]